jgi:hypothetical protein
LGKSGRKGSASSRRAILGLLIVLLIIFGDIITGASSIRAPTVAIGGCNSPSSLEQCGTSSCTPTGSPVISCAVTITFSPAFAATPNFAGATYTGCNPSCHDETSPSAQGSLVFQSDNGETWANMPVAKTEIYGTTNHEMATFTSSTANTAAFSASCITGSASATAVLRPEYSLDVGTTWHELAQNTGGLDILVDASDCSFATTPAFVTGPAGIASAVQGSTVFYRVVGINGNGAGDNVVFNNIEIVFYGIISEIYMVCIQGATFPAVGCAGDPVISKTKMTIRITRMAPSISGPATAVAFNWIATE